MSELDSAPDFEVFISRPIDWVDRTMTVYAHTSRSGFEANVVLARDAMTPSETLETYTARQRSTFKQSLPTFRLEREESRVILDYPASELLFTWQSGQGLLRQRTLFISIGRNRLVTFASTAAAEDYAGLVGTFEDILGTLTIGPVAPDASALN